MTLFGSMKTVAVPSLLVVVKVLLLGTEGAAAFQHAVSSVRGGSVSERLQHNGPAFEIPLVNNAVVRLSTFHRVPWTTVSTAADAVAVTTSTRLYSAQQQQRADQQRASFRASMKRLCTFPVRKVRKLFLSKEAALSNDNDNADESVETKSLQEAAATTFQLRMRSTLTPTAIATSAAVLDDDDGDDAQTTPVVTATAVKEVGIMGDRWAVAGRGVDLTGKWEIKTFVTESFKKDYDEYLKMLGQPLIVRSVAVSIVGLTTEETIQSKQGRELVIRGRNVRGIWERTLFSSGADKKTEQYTPTLTSMVTADAETVEAEAWWEGNGKVHRSFLRGVKKYGGGSFESLRYLQDNGKVLVCESIFHPDDTSREKAKMTWRFLRQGAKQ